MGSMTDRELDAAIAERFFGKIPSRNKPSNNKGYRDAGSPTHWEWEPLNFSTDRNAAALVLERVGEMGIWKKWAMVMGAQDYTHPIALVWNIATATPRQLMEAALAAVEEKY